MKLAIVTAYPPSKVTLNEYAYHLVKQFRLKHNISELILLTDKTDGEKHLDFEGEGCKVTVHECWSFNSYKNVFSVSKALKQTKPDAVLFNLQFMKFGDKKVAAALGLMLPMICRLKRIPNVVLLHNILEEVDLASAGFASSRIVKWTYSQIGRYLTKLILKANVVAVTIQKYVDVLQKNYKAKHIKLIPHGTFEIPEEPDFTLPNGPLQIMTFGKFGTYKRVEAMIEAVELVRATTGLDLEIVIAGTDNPNVPGYLDRVKQECQHVPQLRFTSYVEEADVPKLFKESAVVVFPYTSTTGSSGVLHQAGSYGKAVVMPNLGDLALLVKDEGYQGEFFEPGHVESMAEAIKAIVCNEAYRLLLAKANYKAATAYPMSRIADMYIEEFEKLIDKKVVSKDKSDTSKNLFSTV